MSDQQTSAPPLPAGVTIRDYGSSRSWLDAHGVELVYASPRFADVDDEGDNPWMVVLVGFVAGGFATATVTVECDADRLDALAAIHLTGQVAVRAQAVTG